MHGRTYKILPIDKETETPKIIKLKKKKKGKEKRKNRHAYLRIMFKVFDTSDNFTNYLSAFTCSTPMNTSETAFANFVILMEVVCCKK